MNAIEIRVNGGYIRATVNDDPNYPGIDVEFVSDTDDGSFSSRPRVLMEKPLEGELRALIWSDKNKEDYTEEILFDK